MASLLEKLKLKPTGAVSKTSTPQFGVQPQRTGGYLPQPTSFSVVDKMLNKSSQSTPKPTVVPTQSTTNISSAPTNTPVTPSATPTQTQNTTVQQAAAFKSKYGKNPTFAELEQEKAGTYRPPTPAPNMLRDAEKVATGDVTELSLATKLLKQQYGDTFSDDELALLAKKQLEQGKTDLTATEKALADIQAQLTGQSEAALKRMRDEEERLAQQREAQLAKYEEAIRAQAQADKEEAQRVGREAQTTEERLLGARGNLTSTVGANRLEDIQRQTSNAINAVNARVNAQLAMEKARLEGADQETIQGLEDRYNAALDAEQSAQLESERILQEAKLQAQQSGDQAFMNLIQNAIDQASLKKVASQVDIDVSKFINDGYVYDANGKKIKDTEGNFMTYETSDELDGLMEISAGASIFDPATGQFIGTAPKDGQTAQQAEQALLDSAKNAGAAYEELNTLLNSPELIAVFGPKSSALPAFISGNKPTVESKLDRIKALLTTTELGRMKGLGAMSDREFQNLSAISTSLNLALKEDVAKAEIEKVMKDLEPTVVFDRLLNQGVPIEEAIQTIKETYPDNSRFRNTTASFNQPAGTGSTTLRDGMRARTPLGTAVLTGVEAGSKKWKYGLDMVLSGGKGAPVPFPFTGTVLSAQTDGGFGNSVRVQLPNGLVMRTSHLDAMSVKPGQQISAGQIIGTQGNSGDVYSLSGGDGTHLDITIYDPNGNPYSSQQVAQILGVTPLA